MPRVKKSWQKKLADAKGKVPTPSKFHCDKSNQDLVVPSVSEIEQFIRQVPPGRLLTIKQITDNLKEKHAVDNCCPMTTGIFAWIIAHASDEAEQAGGPPLVPWWRLLKTGGELNPKYPGKGEVQRAKLQAEGHRILSRGRKLVVDGYHEALLEVK